MKRKLTISLIFIMALSPFLMAQELPEVIPPSPTVANLMQFEEVPISYYTGQPNISIPIYSKPITNKLSMNIGLSYNTQGVKINSRSGWTGTGWTLAAGGAISRTVRDVPDEIKKNTNGYIGIKTGAHHLTEYWDYESLTFPQKEEYNWKANGTSLDKYDTELDLYQFDFMGYSGRFVVVKDGNDLKAKQLNQGSNLDIVLYNNGSQVGFGANTIDEIRITDTNGYLYTFDQIETSLPTTFSGTIPQGDPEGVVPVSGSQEYINLNTAWHLTSVKNAHGENLVTFGYDSTYNETYIVSVSRTYNRLTSLQGNPNFNNQDVQDNEARLEPKQSLSYYQISAQTQKLSTINFRDGTSVEFNSINNHPETNGAQLQSIAIKNGASTNKTYSMTYETTTDTSIIPSQSRLWLTKITETAGSINLDYILEYDDKASLPGFDNINLTDDWGYYVGTGTTDCGIYEPNSGSLKKGLLKRIIYPTGGAKEFVFGKHTASYFGNTQLTDDEYRDQNPDNFNATSVSQTFNSATQNAYAGSSFFTSFMVSQTQEVVYQRGATTATVAEQQNAFIEITGPNNYLQRFALDAEEVKFTVDSGTYEIRFGTLTTGTNYNVAMCIGYKNFNTPIDKFVFAGGFRVEQVIFKNDPLSAEVERRIIVNYDDENDSDMSSGVLDSEYYRLFRSYKLKSFSDSCPESFGSSGNPVKSEYEVTEKGTRVQATQGGYVGYRHVKVFETGNGYTTYNYTSAYDYPSPSTVFNLPNPTPAPNIDFKRGLLLKERIYNANNDILKEVSNVTVVGNDEVPNYTFTESALYSARFAYKNPDCAEAHWYDKYSSLLSGIPDNTNGCTYSSGPKDTYYNCGGVAALQKVTVINSTLAQLTETNTNEYFYENGTPNIKSTEQQFQYNADNNLISQEDAYYFKSGTQEHLQTKYYYPVGPDLGSNSIAVKNDLISINKIEEVLEVESFRNGTKLSTTYNVYNEFDTGIVLPLEVRVGKNTLTPTTRINFHDYDDYENPKEVSQEDGIKICYIYGFNGTLPVAKLTNIDYASIESAFGGTFTPPSGNLSASDETTLRGITNTFVSFYRYDPIKGLISSEDDKEYEMTYEYDELNRLLRVKDTSGHILSENSYNYKNQY
ncbi:RHS repeat domain-containing protein [Winogradskyella tangerina]|uniref:hypothetical protein n=1 Tax=Winogradskyella tangerina TaxID=2023240 RepID=UPI0013009E44|nr:hypothetical protein [Winogradskyella tangerina]